jgi:tetratricopeptide (TPR) repeat protein
MSAKTVLLLTSLCLLLLTACSSQEKPDELIVEHGAATGIPSIDAISRDIQNNPNNIQLYVARTDAYAREGLYKEAVKDAQKVLKMDTTRWQSYKLLAWSYLDNDESKRAVKTLEKGLEIQPKNINLLLTHAEISHILKQYEKGLISVDNILKQNERHVEGLFMKGLIRKDMKDTLGAINHFQSAVEEDANHFSAYLEFANLFYKMREPIAVDYYKNALRIDSTSYLAHKGMTNYYHQTGQHEKAKKAYERAIYHHPQEADLSYNYALLYMELEEHQKAFDYFDIATKYDPQFGKAHFYRGLAAEKLNNIDEATRSYKNAKSNGDKNLRLRAIDALDNLPK